VSLKVACPLLVQAVSNFVCLRYLNASASLAISRRLSWEGGAQAHLLQV
jgi:hypothetical protein